MRQACLPGSGLAWGGRWCCVLRGRAHEQYRPRRKREWAWLIQVKFEVLVKSNCTGGSWSYGLEWRDIYVSSIGLGVVSMWRQNTFATSPPPPPSFSFYHIFPFVNNLFICSNSSPQLEYGIPYQMPNQLWPSGNQFFSGLVHWNLNYTAWVHFTHPAVFPAAA